MTAADVVLVGGGEHARVVAEAVRTRPERFRLVGFVDPTECQETQVRLDLEHLGEEDWVRDRRGVLLIWGVGALPRQGLRRAILARICDDPARWPSVVHAAAWVSPTARLEAGAQVLAGAIVQSGAVIGAHAIVNTSAVVEHDVDVGAFCHVAPAAVIGGGARVGADCYIGLGARIRDHIVVGARSVVAMGAVVVADLATDTEVVGVPAKPLRTQS